METGWLHAEALHERSGIQQSFGIHPWQFLQYLGEIFAVVSPPIMAGIWVATIGLWRFEGNQARVKHLLSQFLPVQVMYLILGLNSKGEPNWIAPSLITGIVMLVVFWRQVDGAETKLALGDLVNAGTEFGWDSLPSYRNFSSTAVEV